MFEGRTLRSASLHALLIAAIMQGMTADPHTLASSGLLQRLADALCNAPHEQLPANGGSLPSRDGDNEATPDEVCVAGEPVTGAALGRHMPGFSRSRCPRSGPIQPNVQPTFRLLRWSLGPAPHGCDLTLSLCRLTC